MDLCKCVCNSCIHTCAHCIVMRLLYLTRTDVPCESVNCRSHKAHPVSRQLWPHHMSGHPGPALPSLLHLALPSQQPKQPPPAWLLALNPSQQSQSYPAPPWHAATHQAPGPLSLGALPFNLICCVRRPPDWGEPPAQPQTAPAWKTSRVLQPVCCGNGAC